MDEPTTREIVEHFGYEKQPWAYGVWPNTPGQIERLTQLPELIRTIGAQDQRYHINFDYDPDYPYMLLQIEVC